MTDPQPNKPDGEIDDDAPENVEDRGAVEDQGESVPDEYPDKAEGQPDYGGN